MSIYTTIVSFFQNGGAFMYPIAVVLVIGVAIAIERFIYLSIARGQNRRTFQQLQPSLQRRDFKNVLQAANQSKVAIANIISAGLSRLASSQRREDVEYAMEEGLMETLPKLERRTQYLATLANVATLLGLLGTIIGLIDAFTAVASADPAQKATLLSESISVAMNTTAFGLMSAIPLLLCHALLQSKTTEIVDSMEMACVKVLNLLADRKPAPAVAATNNPQAAARVAK